MRNNMLTTVELSFMDATQNNNIADVQKIWELSSTQIANEAIINSFKRTNSTQMIQKLLTLAADKIPANVISEVFEGDNIETSFEILELAADKILMESIYFVFQYRANVEMADKLWTLTGGKIPDKIIYNTFEDAH